MTEKKIKSSVEGITLPDDAKKRIISKCAEIERTGTNDNAEYTDHVFNVERVKPNRIRRIVSGIAACAVLAGGIGVTGSLLYRQGGSHLGSEVGSETAEEIKAVYSPFGDFNNFDYVLDTGDGNYKKYPDETNAKLSDFMNNFNWGTETEPDIAEQAYEGPYYAAKWENEQTLFFLHILGNGEVSINAVNKKDKTQIDSHCYYIDFDEFDKGIKEILNCVDSDENAVNMADLEPIRYEMLEKITSPVYDANCNAKLTSDYVYTDSSVTGTIEQDMTDAMIYGLAGWINSNSDRLVSAPKTAKLLFNVVISRDEEHMAEFLFYEENLYSCTIRKEDGTSDSYFFKGDCNEALEAVRSATDTEQKHTEDNFAYYLPGFNFEKIGITGDPETDSALQEIFYGYDWAAHEVDDKKFYPEMPDYSFYYTLSDENGDYTRNLEVYQNGYIYLFDMDMNMNKIHPDEEKIYKFDNDNIYKALNYYYESHPMAPDFSANSEESAVYGYESDKNVSPAEFMFEETADLEYCFLDTDLSGTFSEFDKLMALNMLDVSFDMNNELPDKEYAEKFGKITLSISDVSPEDGSPFETTVHITDKNYMIISANDGNHIYKARENIKDAAAMIRDLIVPQSGININQTTGN